jgi:hypothetical protein
MLKGFCLRNYSTLNSELDDVLAALDIAQKAFVTRLGDYEKMFKLLVRAARDIYGTWTSKFKVFFVVNGLLNFSSRRQELRQLKTSWTHF